MKELDFKQARPLLVGLLFTSLFLGSSIARPSWLAPALVLVLFVLSYGRPRAILPVPYLWFLPFLAVLTLGVLRSGANQSYALTVLVLFAYLCLLSLAISGAASDLGEGQAVLSAIAVAAVVMVVQIAARGGIAAFVDAVVVQDFRLGWEVGQPNMAGQAAAVGAVIAINNALTRGRRYVVVWGSLAAVLLAAALGTQSRRAWLIVVVALLTYSVLTRSRGMAFSLAAGSMSFVALAALSGDPRRLESLRGVLTGDRGTMTGSDGARVDLAQVGIESFWESPVLGRGTGELRWANEAAFGEVVASHNNFVEVLANNGLLGFLAFYAPLLSIWWILVRRALESRDPVIANVTALLTADLVVSGSAAITYLDPLSTAIRAVAVAAAVGWTAMSRASQSPGVSLRGSLNQRRGQLIENTGYLWTPDQWRRPAEPS